MFLTTLPLTQIYVDELVLVLFVAHVSRLLCFAYKGIFKRQKWLPLIVNVQLIKANNCFK